MSLQLRDYQREAVDSLYAYFARHDGHPLLVLPTGSGKSIILSAFIQEVMQQWPTQRVLMVTHVKELIEQNYSKLLALWPSAPVGLYSAGLGRRDTVYPITFAGIQSVHTRASEFGRVDLVVIDEAHLVPKGTEGMYRTFLEALTAKNPALKVIGLTATPYRLKGGLLHVGSDRLFTDIAYEVDLLRLIDGGYLCPLVPKKTRAEIDTSGVHSRGGEFIARELEAAAEAGDIVARAVDEIVEHGATRRCWLAFCVGKDHARKVQDELRRRGVSTEIVLGDTPAAERARILRAYKAGQIRCLVNVNVLTTGFDAPETDLLAVLRPTQSTGLYVQIMGRGMRVAEGKTDCLVLDFGGNVARHGPIDRVNPKGVGNEDGAAGEPLVKVCPQCDTQVWIGAGRCHQCGYEWPVAENPPHDSTAATDALLSSQQQAKTYEVRAVHYRRHQKPDKPPSLRVDYVVTEGNVPRTISEWVCIEHTGYARYKAEAWWMRRSGWEPREWVPTTVEDAIALAVGLLRPETITTRPDGKYERITTYGWPEAATDAEHAGEDASRAG